MITKRKGKSMPKEWQKNRNLIPLKTKVYYDVFNFGINIPAIIVKENGVKAIKAIGEDARNFNKIGMTPICDLDIADDIRLRNNNKKIINTDWKRKELWMEK
jgi:hypothetical protein